MGRTRVRPIFLESFAGAFSGKANRFSGLEHATALMAYRISPGALDVELADPLGLVRQFLGR
jgi:hypothetical protein